MKSKINWPLAVAIALPIFLVLSVAISMYIPGRNVSYKGRFLYAIGNDWYPGTLYSVENGRLKTNAIHASPGTVVPTTSTVQLYVYDLQRDHSDSLTLAEAQRLMLDDRPISEEGHAITHGSRSNGDFLFFGSQTDYSRIYVTSKKGVGKRLNVTLSDTTRYKRFHFIGWVKS